MGFQKGHPPYTRKATSAPQPDLSQLKTVLDQLATAVTVVAQQTQQVTARLDAIENQTARFVPMQHERAGPTVLDFDPKMLRATNPQPSTADLLRAPVLDQPAILGNLPVGSNGLELGEDFIVRFPPRFRPGSKVRINPDFKSEIGEDEDGNPIYRTKTEEYARTRQKLDTLGEVLRIQKFSAPHRSWKYSVRFPGITTPKGNGYFESELVGA